MKVSDKVSYKTDNSLQVYNGRILEFKLDKIKVSKFKFSDFSGWSTTTWISKEEILTIN